MPAGCRLDAGWMPAGCRLEGHRDTPKAGGQLEGSWRAAEGQWHYRIARGAEAPKTGFMRHGRQEGAGGRSHIRSPPNPQSFSTQPPEFFLQHKNARTP